MKFIVLGYYDPKKFEAMSESDRNAMFDTCLAYDDVLRKDGNFVGGEALQPIVRKVHSKNGKVQAVDGPFAETKELIGGLMFLEARDLDHAAELISKHPAVVAGNTFEIRPVADMTEIFSASERRRVAAGKR